MENQDNQLRYIFKKESIFIIGVQVMLVIPSTCEKESKTLLFKSFFELDEFRKNMGDSLTNIIVIPDNLNHHQYISYSDLKKNHETKEYFLEFSHPKQNDDESAKIDLPKKKTKIIEKHNHEMELKEKHKKIMFKYNQALAQLAKRDRERVKYLLDFDDKLQELEQERKNVRSQQVRINTLEEELDALSQTNSQNLKGKLDLILQNQDLSAKVRQLQDRDFYRTLKAERDRFHDKYQDLLTQNKYLEADIRRMKTNTRTF